MCRFLRRAPAVLLVMLASQGLYACGGAGLPLPANPGARDVPGEEFEYRDRAVFLPAQATKLLCDRTRADETSGGVDIGPGGGRVELSATLDTSGARTLVATLVVPEGAVSATTRFTLQMPRSRRAVVYVTATRDGVDFRGPFAQPLSVTVRYAGRNCTVNGNPAPAANVAAYKSSTADGHPDPDILRREGGAHMPSLQQVQFLISTLSGYIMAEG